VTAHVVDASVVAAAFFRERHSDAARALLTGGDELYAPDLVWAEVANVIWKRCGRGEIEAAEAAEMLRDVLALPLQVTPSDQLAEDALELALRTGRTVYDCLYLAVAVRTGSPLLTADKRLVNALAKTPVAAHVAWLGDRRGRAVVPRKAKARGCVDRGLWTPYWERILGAAGWGKAVIPSRRTRRR